jgi:hypothetical protein
MCVCVCAFLLHRESPSRVLGDKPLLFQGSSVTTRKRFIIITRIIIVTRKSIFITSYIFDRGRGTGFYFFLHSFAMRHACFESLGNSDLLDEVLPLMAMVAKSSLSDSELSSLEFQS